MEMLITCDRAGCFTIASFVTPRDFADEEYGQKSVSVMLDGQETELEIIDHPSSEISVSNVLARGEEKREEKGEETVAVCSDVPEDRSRDKLHRMNRSDRTREEIVLTSFNKP